MPHLLHIDSSARRGSFSRELTARFATVWRRRPTATYVYRDVAAEPIPFIGEGWTQLCDAILAEGITDIQRYADVVRTAGRRQAWGVVAPLLAELDAADVVLIGAPMYNFSIPASLKAWIDQVTFPRMSLKGKAFIVAGARGGSYRPGTPRAPYDHHELYLRHFIAGHFGVDDVRFLNTELTNALVDPSLVHLKDGHETSRAAALADVDGLIEALAGVRA